MEVDVTVFFQNGQVVKMLPEPTTSYYEVRDFINKATSIVSDGVAYNLKDKNSIYSIAVPKYVYNHQNSHAIELGVTGYLDYVLRMHAGLCWRNKEYEISIACLGKATQLMKYSTIGWQKKDFYRIVDWLEQIGRFEKANEWKEWIEKNVPSLQEEVFHRTNASIDFLGTDLVYTSWAGSQSAATAKYQGRVYSVSGKDKRFPALPDFMKEPQEICPISGPFIFWNDKKLDTIYYKGKNVHVFKASWRPFIDDRTEQEKNAYKSLQAKLAKQEEAKIARSVYFHLKYLLPDDAPKSLSAFSRMKNECSEKYLILVEKAKNAGYVFPKMTVDFIDPKDPEPNYKGGHKKPLFLRTK